MCATCQQEASPNLTLKSETDNVLTFTLPKGVDGKATLFSWINLEVPAGVAPGTKLTLSGVVTAYGAISRRDTAIMVARK